MDHRDYEIDLDGKFINKASLITLLEYLRDASKKTDPKETYILMAKERFESDMDYVINLVKAYPELPDPDHLLPKFLEEDSK